MHVGTHKTGTTALQNAFDDNRAMLARHGVIYPRLGRHSGHHGFLTDWIALPAAYHSPAGGIAGLQALADDLRDTDVTLVLSSEEFSRGGGPGGKVDMAQLRAIFVGWETVQVLCLLRSQWQFLQSVYLEIGRSRLPPPPPALVENAVATGMIDGLWCDYDRLRDHLLTGFHPDQLRLMSFDSVAAQPDGVLGAVLDLLGVTLPTDDRARIVAHRANRSPAPLSTWASFAISDGHMPSTTLRAAAQTAWDLEYGRDRRGCLFTRAEIDRLRRHFRPVDSSLPQIVPQIMPWTPAWCAPGADTIFRDDLHPAFWIRLARRLYLS